MSEGRGPGSRPTLLDAALVALGGLVAWFPCETSPMTALVLAPACGGLGVWAWRRTGAATRSRAVLLMGAILLLGALGCLAGWDADHGLRQLAMVVGVSTIAWVASRRRPNADTVLVLCLVVAFLSVWAAWQVLVGFDQALARASEVPEAARQAFVFRLETGRAFASQTVPGHLAVLLATVLPLLLVRVGRSRSGVVAGVGSLLCVLGIALTRSPIGAGLGLAAAAAVVLVGRRRWAAVVLVAMAAVMVTVVVVRADLMMLEPIRLRVENWRTAAWVWKSSPVTGAGLGGFGQASLAVPFDVGNRPVHAHSLPLELLADLGPVGLILGAAAGLWLLLLVRRLWVREPALAAAALVVPAHNLVDFSCYSWGVMGPWAVLLGWALAGASDEDAPTAERGRVGPTIVVASALVLLAGLHSTSRLIERQALEAEKMPPVRRYQLAATASRLAPWRVDPAELAAAMALETGPDSCEEAAAFLRRTSGLRPGSASLRALEARLALCRGSLPDAVAATWAAVTASGGSARYEEEWGRLRRAMGGEPRAGSEQDPMAEPVPVSEEATTEGAAGARDAGSSVSTEEAAARGPEVDD